jgi:hypothetical protein
MLVSDRDDGNPKNQKGSGVHSGRYAISALMSTTTTILQCYSRVGSCQTAYYYYSRNKECGGMGQMSQRDSFCFSLSYLVSGSTIITGTPITYNP